MARYDTKQHSPDTRSDILVAIPSSEDPFLAGGLAGGELAGPILSVLQVCPLQKVFLVRLAGTGDVADQCATLIGERHAHIPVEVVDLFVADLGDPAALRSGIGALFPHLLAKGRVALLVPAGLPYLYSVLLAYLAENEDTARIIDVVRPTYPSTTVPVVRTLSNPFLERGSSPPDTVREPSAVYVHRRTAAEVSAQDSPDTGNGKDQEWGAEAVAASLGFVSDHPTMRALLQTVDAVAPHQVPILIQGETGTGKGMCARLVHALSPMRTGPFVAVNCGALPEQLIESQLFGHREGAFTGATRDHAGKFEQADGGTLFLDEIGELPMPLQPKLLRVLEDGMVESLGAAEGRSVNVRVIAATHLDLRGAVARREFREDLYYRLAFAVLPIPALRDRRSDIPALALQFLSRLNRSMKTPRSLSATALTRLTRLSWQGNVRDLENVIGRSVLLSGSDRLGAEDLVVDEPMSTPADGPGRSPKLGNGFDLEAYLSDLRRDLVEQALTATGGNQRAAAELLGVSRQAVSRFVKDLREETGSAE